MAAVATFWSISPCIYNKTLRHLCGGRGEGGRREGGEGVEREKKGRVEGRERKGTWRKVWKSLFFSLILKRVFMIPRIASIFSSLSVVLVRRS